MDIFKRTSVGLVVGAALLCTWSNAAQAADETRTTTTYSGGGNAPAVTESRTTTSSPTVIQERSTGSGDATSVYPSSTTTNTIEQDAVVPDEPQVVRMREKKKQKHLLHVGIPFTHAKVL